MGLCGQAGLAALRCVTVCPVTTSKGMKFSRFRVRGAADRLPHERGRHNAEMENCGCGRNGVFIGFLTVDRCWASASIPGAIGAKVGGAIRSTPGRETAAEAYKNIKVLKDIPSYELIPTMEFISASLGVHCDYCHVEHHFDEDTKKPKQRAREMMQMMFAIDKDSFHGHLQVTCNTCHNGARHPAGMPAVAAAGEVQASPAHMEEHGRRANLASLPQPDAIVGKYVVALGGADALRKVKSRVMTGTMTAFGHTMPVEIYAQAPDEMANVIKSPRGQSMTVYNGHEGWASMMPRPPHPLEGSELDRARLDADFYFPLDIQKLFTSMRERPPQKVGDEEAYVVLGCGRASRLSNCSSASNRGCCCGWSTLPRRRSGACRSRPTIPITARLTE